MPQFNSKEEYEKWKSEKAKEAKENPNRNTSTSAVKSNSKPAKSVAIVSIKKTAAVIRTLLHNWSEASKRRKAVKKIRQQEQLQKQLQRYKNSNRKMNCPSCHASISVNAVACPKCGQPITDSIWKKEILRKQNNSNVLAAIVLIPTALFVCLIGIALIIPKGALKSNHREDISTLPNPKSQSVAIDPRLIIQFEKSEVFQKYAIRERSQWTLNTGGVNFNYMFTDPDSPDERSSIEMTSDQGNIKTLGIILKGSSTLQPAKLTVRREERLYNLIRFFYPTLNFDELMALIRAEGGISYDGGSDSMPRKKFNADSVYVGTVGPDLIVGIESQGKLLSEKPESHSSQTSTDTSSPSSSYSSSEAERTRKELEREEIRRKRDALQPILRDGCLQGNQDACRQYKEWENMR